MAKYRISDKDKKELNIELPDLNCEVVNQKIWGTLSFCCYYDVSQEKLEHNSQHQYAISDSYEIEILFAEENKAGFDFPTVYEKSFKIPKKEQYHVNENGSCCLGIFPEYQLTTAYDFITEKVIPFFYWQSHRMKYQEPPWGEYLHRKKGLEQAKKENIILTHAKGSDRNAPCPCGSNIKYKNCCKSKDDIYRNI